MKKSAHLQIKNLSDTQQLTIKKVDKAYYNYLYSYELQQQDEENTIIKPQNQEFIGIWGACYPIEIPL